MNSDSTSNDQPPTSDLTAFHTVAKVGQIPEGEGRSFVVLGRMIGVFLRDGEYFAINDSCPHMGASLASGYVDGTEVICPWHAWRFCIKDGAWLDNPKSKVRTEAFAVQIQGDEIQVCPTPLPVEDCTHLVRA
jgi:nitrite reductase (NADH) small subunit/3-phenylpropionate/trans-cinnamate dioxygenase ferredoxin subunit